ncbi:MAG: peptidyl-prolyl cis-trans isomerase [Planctomycetota bacterium]|jgi:parvulin-like peptidyl-prolyl isomerase
MRKSPIVHIILFGCLLGVILVVVFGRPSAVDDTTRVVVTAGDIAQLRAGWMRRWMREPTAAELRGLIESFVRDEVLYREAVRRGYDKNDGLVRQTLKRKMEFLGEAQAEKTKPSLEEMQAYYAMRKERYRVPPIVSFEHIYFSQDKRGAEAEADAKQALERLVAENSDQAELSGYGDRFMLKNHYVGQDEQQIRREFGGTFAEQVVSLAPGTWQGPIPSGYGIHLVKVYDHQAAYLPELKVIEEKIRNDMDYENREAARQLFYTEILRNYQVEYDDSIKGLLERRG